jgi:hypothetical protein
MTIITVIICIVALPFIIALFVKKDYSIERSMIINKPKGDVFNYVRHLKNQDHYSKWVMTDPNMKKEFKGTDGTVGFVYAWDSQDKNAGKGEQEIKGLKEGQIVDVEVRFERPFAGIARTPIKTESVNTANGEQTNVTWGMHGKSKYPMNLINLFMGKMLAKDLETSLGTLKNILEKR